MQRKYAVFAIGFFLLPVISGILFCAKDGHFLKDIYIALGGWSDEITYYKQIEGMLSHGSPVGYFGYNQSRAIYGPYSVWGIIPLIPYYLLGLIFGWNYQMPIYFNIIFCCFGMLFVGILLKPSIKEMLSIAIIWFSYYDLNRYILSGVVEAFYVAMLLIIFSCGIYLLSEKNGGGTDAGIAQKML